MAHEAIPRRRRIVRPSLLMLVTIVMSASCTTPERGLSERRSASPVGDPAGDRSSARWLNTVNVVSVWQLDRDQQARFGIDLPGVFTWWDAAKVRALQQRGRIAVVSVEGLAAEPYLLRRHPELRAAISRDVFGNESRAGWYQSLQGAPEPVVVLTIESPIFQQYLLAQGRRAVDIGADAFYIDEIQTSALLLGTEPHASGFSPLEVEAYEHHLGQLGFGSPAAWLRSRTDLPWLTEELSTRLASPELGEMSIVDLLTTSDTDLAIPRLALFAHYRSFHEDRAIEIMSGIVDQVRAYAAERGGSMAVGANLAGMGDRTWWSPLMSVGWGRLLDFIVYEHDVEVPGSSVFELSFPRGSFAPTYRLGNSLTPGLVAAFPSVAFAPALHELERNGTYLAIMYAEAFAFEGNWALGWWNEEMHWPRGELAPDSLVPLTRYVRRWHRIYEGPRRANDVAILYSNQAVLEESQRHRSYVGLAQALGSLGVQYDVVYAGDDRFGEAPLRVEDLAGHGIVFVPAANALTEQQVRVLEGHAGSGGHVVAMEPVDPALNTADIEVIDDLGLAFRSGDGWALHQLDRVVGDTGRVRLASGAEGLLATTYMRATSPGWSCMS